MSGGEFSYNQFKIQEIAEDLDVIIQTEAVKPTYSKETIYEFKTALKILKQAFVYVHRIDWLVSGDDGEDTFHKRLKEELYDL